MTVVTIIITTLIAVETLFSIATVSRQIEKRLFLQTTFGTSSKRLRSRRRVSICMSITGYIYRGNMRLSRLSLVYRVRSS